MAESFAFKLDGSYQVTPLGNPASFAQTLTAPISEALTINQKQETNLDLTSDVTPLPVPFGGVTNANLVVLKAVGGKARARLTSADGSQQAIPFDTYLILMNDKVPITAIDLLRDLGVAVTVRVFLGQKA
jgi:hypothetical protein